MMTTPPGTSASPSTAARSGNGHGGGLPFSDEDPRRRQRLLIGGVGGVLLVVAVALLFIFRPWQHPAPTLGGDPVQLGRFAGAGDLQKMPFDKREIYMKMMNSKKDDLAKAYAAGQLSLEDYQKALIAGHLGKQLEDMRKYFAKPVGPDRQKYLDKLMAKKDTKEETIKHNPAAKEQKKEQDLLKDDTAMRAEIATWPPDVQAEYQEFRNALEEHKKAHKGAKEAKAAATMPATPGGP